MCVCVQLNSPPRVAKALPVDNVDLSDIVLTLDESNRIFSDNKSDEIKVVYEDLQDSDSDTVLYLPNVSLHVSPLVLPPGVPVVVLPPSCLTSEIILSGYLDGRIATQNKFTVSAFIKVMRISERYDYKHLFV